ncbi:T9SS type A sorting domain-containing protein [candidate division KSB1 bacterium]|nr:T9SS type A sorting domain-containing protein [candidate division KSB1 bacterium]
MIRKTFCIWVIISISLIISGRVSFSQDPNVGDPMYTKWGWMDGNQIRIQFANHSEVGHWPDPLSGEWPRGSGTAYIDGVAFIVAAEAVDVNGNTFHTAETQYREFMDNMAVLPWGFYPLPGYCNSLGNSPAISDDPYTWPDHWPGQPDSMDGHWNGYFGMDNFYPNLESYFVIDDDKDLEFDFYPDSTDSSRRGLGIEVSIRGFQWDHQLAEDILIWQYDIINEGTTDYDQVHVGIYFDSGVGNDAGSDDCGFYDEMLDLAYAWDYDNIGGHPPNTWSPVAYTGFSFLDTPDQSGLTGFQCFPVHYIELDDDELVWEAFSGPPAADPVLNVNLGMLASSGPFSLSAGETKRVTMAILFGWDLDDLCNNAYFARAFCNGGYSFDVHYVTVTYPNGGENISGETTITWTTDGLEDTSKVTILVSPDNGDSWDWLAGGEENDGVYDWNTTDLEDGVLYRVQVFAMDENGVGGDISNSFFTINNPGPASPNVDVLTPQNGEEIQGTYDITWVAGDADGDSVWLTLYYSYDWGYSWQPISVNELNDGIYEWDTGPYPNTNNGKIKAVVTDGELFGEDLSPGFFRLNNFHPILADSLLEHISGFSDGYISVNVVDASVLTGHQYEIIFDDTSDTMTTYDIYDLNDGQYVVENADEIYGMEGPFFDGLRLWMEDIIDIVPKDSLIEWIVGDCNLELQVGLDLAYSSETNPMLDFNVAYPADYEIRYYDTIVDTSTNFLGSFPAIPTYFEVWNLTDSVNSLFAFGDADGDSLFSLGDSIIILVPDESFWYGIRTTWKISFRMPDTTLIPPDAGDVAYIPIWKPFSSRDVYRFQAPTAGIPQSGGDGSLPQEYSLSQNYPNPFNPTTIINYSIPAPEKVKIIIYNVIGQEVRTLVDKDQTAGIYQVVWGGKDVWGRDVASGVYFCRMQAGNFSKVIKMLLIR